VGEVGGFLCQMKGTLLSFLKMGYIEKLSQS
jgi:hypothetical protein